MEKKMPSQPETASATVENETLQSGSYPRWHIHRRMYDWVIGWASTPYGIPALAAISFMESSIFPIPPDVLLIALVLGAPQRWLSIAAYCTIASVLGGVAGYGIGVFAWETIGQWVVETIVHVQLVMVDGRLDIALPAYLLNAFGEESLGGSYLFQAYDYWNAWIVFIFGLTPLPYKLVTITAGVAKVNLPIFMLASVLSRAARFFAVAYILKTWGPAAKKMLEKNFNVMCFVFTFLLIGSYVLVKMLLSH